ncbi:MAG: hypothetical protein RQ748_00720 [Elusimicrobiales bacterium]|nr:hypothetical protein [Elusimicrobiales bacterium]
MPAEKGIRLGTMSLEKLGRSGALEDALRAFDRFYIGPEFCGELLDDSLCGDAVRLRELGKKVCVLTPMLGEGGAERLDRLFARLAALAEKGRLAARALEITVNDFGAVELASRRRLPFRLNAGRLLRDNAFDTTGKPLKVHNGAALDFFRSLGINRFEIPTIGALPPTNFQEGRRYGFDRSSFRLTLHYPYLDLTAARACPTGLPDAAPGRAPARTACARECLISALELRHPFIKERLLLRGNAVFMEFPEKFYASEKELAALNIDRLVYSPFP